MYPSSQYTFIKFQKATGPKKYWAILKNKETKREVKVGVGAKGYEQYKDTALGSYSNLNHNDPKRRASYRSRHKGEGDVSRKYSAGWFAWHYLW
jgi:hypothetical protein